MSDFPEHDKLADIHDDSQLIGEFLEHCGYTLCRLAPSGFCDGGGDALMEFQPLRMSLTQILANYFEIDLNVLEAEKRAMLDEIRKGG